MSALCLCARLPLTGTVAEQWNASEEAKRVQWEQDVRTAMAIACTLSR